ncbi:MAG: hypothetical protein O7E52_07565 [Candidatus Poribacteria bacterium]|nr:hypothetical protein [Candidatus Poribacteria bacterium]
MGYNKGNQPTYSQAMDTPRFPDEAELRQGIPQEHPRMLFSPGDFERLKARLGQLLFTQIFQ